MMNEQKQEVEEAQEHGLLTVEEISQTVSNLVKNSLDEELQPIRGYF
jgi:hypothetical protein